jgi:hypothetical protein
MTERFVGDSDFNQLFSRAGSADGPAFTPAAGSNRFASAINAAQTLAGMPSGFAVLNRQVKSNLRLRVLGDLRKQGLSPADGAAYYNAAANLFAEAGDHEAAQTAYTRALEVDSMQADTEYKQSQTDKLKAETTGINNENDFAKATVEQRKKHINLKIEQLQGLISADAIERVIRAEYGPEAARLANEELKQTVRQQRAGADVAEGTVGTRIEEAEANLESVRLNNLASKLNISREELEFALDKTYSSREREQALRNLETTRNLDEVRSKLGLAQTESVRKQTKREEALESIIQDEKIANTMRTFAQADQIEQETIRLQLQNEITQKTGLSQAQAETALIKAKVELHKKQAESLGQDISGVNHNRAVELQSLSDIADFNEALVAFRGKELTIKNELLKAGAAAPTDAEVRTVVSTLSDIFANADTTADIQTVMYQLGVNPDTLAKAFNFNAYATASDTKEQENAMDAVKLAAVSLSSEAKLIQATQQVSWKEAIQAAVNSKIHTAGNLRILQADGEIFFYDPDTGKMHKQKTKELLEGGDGVGAAAVGNFGGETTL